jgi:hypothetical protein
MRLTFSRKLGRDQVLVISTWAEMTFGTASLIVWVSSLRKSTEASKKAESIPPELGSCTEFECDSPSLQAYHTQLQMHMHMHALRPYPFSLAA